MKNKKGLSAVVTTVLLILISIIAVVLVSSFIIPMVRDSLQSGGSCFNALEKVSIAEDKSYTCYNTADSTARIKIRIDANEEVKLKGVAVSLSGEGESKVFKIYNNTATSGVSMHDQEEGNLELPLTGGAKTYDFKIDFKVESAEIAPILEDGKLCSSSSTLIPACQN